MTSQWITKFVCLCVMGGALVGCSGQANETPVNKKPRPVKTLSVSLSSASHSLSLPAVIEAVDQTELSFQVPGVLTKLKLGKGAVVKQGDVIAQLDQREFRNALAQAKSAFDLAESTYKRNQSLIADKLIAAAVLDESRAQYENTRAQLDTARKNLEDSTLRSPYDAVVADVHVESFESVNSQTSIVTLQTNGLNYAVVQVPASVIIMAKQIEAASVFLKLDAAPDISIPAVMQDHASLADPSTQTFEVRFSFSSPDTLNILPGMTGTMNGTYAFIQKENVAGYEVPLSAVQSDGEQTYVWVVDESNRVSRRNVEVDIAPNGKPQVISGLKAGELVVIAGASYLVEGQEIARYEA